MGRRLLVAVIAVIACLIPPAVSACADGCEGVCTTTMTIATDSFLHPSYVASEPAISASTLVALMTAGAPLFLVDCRNSACLAGPRIPGALVADIDGDASAILARLPSKQAMVVLYDGCACGCRRLLKPRLSAEGYLNLIDYPGGTRDWIAAGRAVVDTLPSDIISSGITMKLSSEASRVPPQR
ncbi:MAG TPA: rhodanese-like domain-containing protein [Candidatus Ozemobacteraceae bacterium]|nr:rhodanese-like domain-containing protein [Candidatus Ozemobacteraceae bacterium]